MNFKNGLLLDISMKVIWKVTIKKKWNIYFKKWRKIRWYFLIWKTLKRKLLNIDGSKYEGELKTRY